jgi:tartrate dehydratase alpha subunit/fumarate hydratase class I-like protein
MRNKSSHWLVVGILAALVTQNAPALANGVRGQSRGSVTRNANANVNRNANVNQNVNRNVNVNVNRNVDVNVHGGYYGGGCCYHDYHPVATAAAVTAAAVVTAAVVGSIVHSVPASCTSVIVNGFAYQQCGSTWYQPQMSGSSTTYVVVNPPR